jgi:hypothetical protein
MSELNQEYRQRKEYGYKRHEDGYHTVIKGCKFNLNYRARIQSCTQRLVFEKAGNLT